MPANIEKKVLVPARLRYSATAQVLPLPEGAYYASIDIPGGPQVPVHKELIHFEHALAPGLDAGFARHTVAIDLKFTGGYLDAMQSHVVLISRHNGLAYVGAGSNRSAAAVLGALPDEHGVYVSHAVGAEEIEITDACLNVMHAVRGDKLAEDHWYRVAVHTVEHADRGIGLGVRVWDKRLRRLVYSLPTVWSAYPHNYLPGGW